jgi:hypothetical protein|tara:strand:- start:2121 stop:2378 length:258 start_codon:yes stop_codon:yes gene_type:complete
MSKIINLNGYIENGQFAGGQAVTGSDPIGSLPFTAGGLYIGQTGNLTAQTIDGSVLTFVSASGFIPGIFTSVSSSTTAGAIIALR